MSKGKYYSTLKLMEQIEHTHLTHVEQFKFAKTIQGIDSSEHSISIKLRVGSSAQTILETINCIEIVVSPISNYQGSSSSNQSR